MAQHQQYHISRISNEHSDWNRGTAFYLDEISILSNRLREISIVYSNEEVKSQVEHFQNQFIIQKNNLEELKKKIKNHEHHLSQDAIHHAQHLTKETIEEHDQLRGQYMDLVKVIVELKHDFYKFVASYM
jgi:hypothetical protein